MANAMWWVRFTDAKTGNGGTLSLCSPDLKDPRAAKKRACDTAKARLAKKGVSAVNLTARCVG